MMYHSAALGCMLSDRQRQQAAQLSVYARKLSLGLELRTQDGQWLSLPRWTDPEGYAAHFNATHVLVKPSELVPGLLGVFSRREAYPPGHDKASSWPANLGLYTGWLFLASEYELYQQRHGHSMGIEVSGLQGRRSRSSGSRDGSSSSGSGTSTPVEKIILVGDPLNSVVQALHRPTGENCRLTNRVQPAGGQLISATVGVKGIALKHNAIVLQARKHVRVGDELTFCYSNQDWGSSPISCMVCGDAVRKMLPLSQNKQSDDDKTDSDRVLQLVDAFRCQGFINGAACPFYLHTACAPAKISGNADPVDDSPYCKFCFSLSEQDTPPFPVWDVAVQQDDCTIRSDAGFATVRQRAAQLGWVVKLAATLPPDAAAAAVPTADERRYRLRWRTPVILYFCQRPTRPRLSSPQLQPRLAHAATERETDGPAAAAAAAADTAAAAAAKELSQDSADADSPALSFSQVVSVSPHTSSLTPDTDVALDGRLSAVAFSTSVASSSSQPVRRLLQSACAVRRLRLCGFSRRVQGSIAGTVCSGQ